MKVSELLDYLLKLHLSEWGSVEITVEDMRGIQYYIEAVEQNPVICPHCLQQTQEKKLLIRIDDPG